jgi:mono/diheme cytochrome c family protein
MPQGMMQLGAQLHQQPGEFAVAAQDAAVTGDTAKPLLLLSRMTQTCVACHATY